MRRHRREVSDPRSFLLGGGKRGNPGCGCEGELRKRSRRERKLFAADQGLGGGAKGLRKKRKGTNFIFMFLSSFKKQSTVLLLLKVCFL